MKQQNTPKQQQNEVVESAATDQTATEQSPQGSIKTLKEFHSASWRNSIDFYSPMNMLKDFYGIINSLLRKCRKVAVTFKAYGAKHPKLC